MTTPQPQPDQSLLQEGESFGTPVTAPATPAAKTTATTQPDQSLLQEGESFGTPVAPVAPVKQPTELQQSVHDFMRTDPESYSSDLPLTSYGAATRQGLNMVAIVNQIVKGKAVNQPGTESAIRSAVQRGTETTGTAEESLAANIENQPIAKGNQTVVDEQLNALRQKEADAYKTLDETAGFDLKAEKAQLANDKYKLSQLGNTDTDVLQRGNLVDAINDSTDRIAEAEVKLKAADIDPKLGDTIHQQRMATQDIRKMLVKNTGADGSLNVKGLLNDSKNLRNSKYGDRLAQAWGSDTADTFQSRLQQMDKLGAHAVTARWAAGIIGYEVIKHTLGSTGGTAAKIATELPL